VRAAPWCFGNPRDSAPFCPASPPTQSSLGCCDSHPHSALQGFDMTIIRGSTDYGVKVDNDMIESGLTRQISTEHAIFIEFTYLLVRAGIDLDM
jgi:hypothetical protein